MPLPPPHAQILVIGGGPAGSYAAAILAREGFDVVLLESAKFPRYHTGESLLPSVKPFLKFVGAEDKVKNYGFTKKPGGAAKLNHHKREGYTDFVALDPESGSWHVIRSEFDDLLLKHAEECGAKVFQETQVTELQFNPNSKYSDSEPQRPVAAVWSKKAPSDNDGLAVNDIITGEIKFDYLIDASGRRGLMSTRYLHNRKFNQSLKNVAHWGYWTIVNKYMPGTTREGAIWIEALTDESGWVWYIPLHDGSTSVGIVMDESRSSEKRRASKQGLQDFYLSQLHHLAPGTMELIGARGKLRNADNSNAVRSASDYSYSAPTYSGDHFRIAGDAGAFIDPFFSSGVHLAFTGGLSAAVTIAASIRGHAPETDACQWHDAKFSTSYTRFLLVVLGVYKQIRNQEAPVLSDVGEDNFDKAFESIRPVIQGTADVGKVVTEDELQKTMDFVLQIFGPVTPDMQKSVSSRIDPKLLSPTAPAMNAVDMAKVIDAGDEEARIVLSNINAWKPLRPLLQPSENFSSESHIGRVAILETGKLGLKGA
ncbi:unnamed protein product [Somion occarium]